LKHDISILDIISNLAGANKFLLTDAPSHKKLRKVVADQMRAAILNEYYKPGEWLRQERLAPTRLIHAAGAECRRHTACNENLRQKLLDLEFLD